MSIEYLQYKFLMENCRKLSFNYHQIPTASVPLNKKHTSGTDRGGGGGVVVIIKG